MYIKCLYKLDKNCLRYEQCATGSKILTGSDLIGIILAGTGPEPNYKPEKVNRIRLHWPDRPDWPDFYRI